MAEKIQESQEVHPIQNDPKTNEQSPWGPDRPSPARFYAVAVGLSEWTAREREAVEADQQLRDYEVRMRLAVGPVTEPMVKSRPHQADPAPATMRPPVKPTPTPVNLMLERQDYRMAGCTIAEPRVFFDAQGQYRLHLYPAPIEGHTTIQFIGEVPARPVSLLADDTPIRFIRDLDEHGYATVRTQDITAVLEGKAQFAINSA